MEKTDKSDEEIDERLLVKRIWQRAYLDTEESHVILIRDYASHQLSEYKEVIKELLPLAQNFASTLKWDEEYSGDEVGGKEAQEIVDRAKALLQESNQGQPPPESEQL